MLKLLALCLTVFTCGGLAASQSASANGNSPSSESSSDSDYEDDTPEDYGEVDEDIIIEEDIDSNDDEGVSG